MLRSSQQYPDALHDSRIVWVGNSLIPRAIFGNSRRTTTIVVAPHFVDPQFGRSDPEAHAVFTGIAHCLASPR